VACPGSWGEINNRRVLGNLPFMRLFICFLGYFGHRDLVPLAVFTSQPSFFIG